MGPPGPASLPELFGDQLFRADGTSTGIEALDDVPIIGIYFASHTCPACGAFSPVLRETYQELRDQGRSFEVVLVSADASASAMFQHMVESSMPWLAVPWRGSKAEGLVNRYDVRWIPTLIVIDHAGTTLSMDGREEVVLKGPLAYDDWLAAAGGA